MTTITPTSFRNVLMGTNLNGINEDDDSALQTYIIHDLEGFSPPITNNNTERHYCVICGDESDGLHFGQYTCRACAAFFRRTVSLKLKYVCKHQNNCVIEKTARNMCRSCRFKKSLQKGMLPTAVQHARDGLGKRKEVQKITISSTSSDTPPDIKMPKPIDIQHQIQQQLRTSKLTNNVANLSLYQPQQQQQQQNNLSPTTSSSRGSNNYTSPITANILRLQNNFNDSNNGINNNENGINNNEETPIYYNFSTLPLNNSLNSYNSESYGSAFTPLQMQNEMPEMKYLSKMLQGYKHFLSLRKASITFVEDIPKFRDKNEIPQSNFSTSKQMCRFEASLIMDTVEQFFIPFNTLQKSEQNILFSHFYCLFSNIERAFRTCKLFGANDNRLIMPDGGYVSLDELEKFYENSEMVCADPAQLAHIFEDAMHYMVNIVVSHMRNLDITEAELMTLCGLFIWKDTAAVSPETMSLILETRDNILIDLHTFYRSQGFIEAQITLRVAKLLLLIPKTESLVSRMKENFHIAELFNMMKLDGCCTKISNCN